MLHARNPNLPGVKLPLLALLCVLASPAAPKDASVKAAIPARLLSPTGRFLSAAWAQGLGRWLLGGTDAFYSLKPGDSTPHLVAKDARYLNTPARLSMHGSRVVFFDARTQTVNDYDIDTRRFGTARDTLAFGGAPYACLTWNGGEWVAAGRLRAPGTTSHGKTVEIQTRSDDLIRVTNTLSLTPSERITLQSVFAYGDCASSTEGDTLVTFQAIGRVLRLDRQLSISASYDLDIPAQRSVAATLGSQTASSPDLYERIFHGKTIPVAVGWLHGLPVVLMVDLGGGAMALTCQVLAADNGATPRVRLAIPSGDARDYFAAAFGAGGRLLVARTPYSGPQAVGASDLYEVDFGGWPPS